MLRGLGELSDDSSEFAMRLSHFIYHLYRTGEDLRSQWKRRAKPVSENELSMIFLPYLDAQFWYAEQQNAEYAERALISSMKPAAVSLRGVHPQY